MIHIMKLLLPQICIESSEKMRESFGKTRSICRKGEGELRRLTAFISAGWLRRLSRALPWSRTDLFCSPSARATPSTKKSRLRLPATSSVTERKKKEKEGNEERTSKEESLQYRAFSFRQRSASSFESNKKRGQRAASSVELYGALAYAWERTLQKVAVLNTENRAHLEYSEGLPRTNHYLTVSQIVFLRFWLNGDP